MSKSDAVASKVQLFDETTRSNPRPARHVEGRFRFLNRAAGPIFDRIRVLLEDWLAAYPEGGQADLIGRFRSGDNRAFSGAFWELYLAEALRRAGYNVTLHPSVPQSSRHPDFLAERSDGSFYLETTVATASDSESAADQRRGRIYDAINSVPSPAFWLGVHIEGEGPGEPKLTSLRHEVSVWLASLDHESVAAVTDHELAEERFGMDWVRNGWHVRFRPIPKGPDMLGKVGTTIGISSGVGGYVDSLRPLRQALREKSSRYGKLDRPYIVAVLIEHWFVDEEDLFNALFGSVAVQISTVLNARLSPRAVRLRDGSWFGGHGPTGTRVSAVMVARGLAVWSVTRIEPQLILNPWASRPLTSEIGWRTTVADRENGTLDTRPATLSAASLFGLPPDWPGPDGPFDDE